MCNWGFNAIFVPSKTQKITVLPEKFQNILASYPSFSLEKVEEVKLMNRIDTKYIIPVDDAVRMLRDLRNDYHVLEIESQRTGIYTSVYYDTDDKRMFYTHVTGRFPRYKVRERHYSQNGLVFFEIKQKSNAGRTSKRRISVSADSNEASEWIPKQSPFNFDELTPALINRFERITLVNNEKTERVTVDFDLSFRLPSGDFTPTYDRIVIVELKQDKTAASKVRNYLRSKGFRPKSISKFCMGMLLTGSETTYKRYKPQYTRFIKTQYGQHD